LFKMQNLVTTPRGLAEHLKLYENTPIRCYLDHILVVGGTLNKGLAERAWARMSPHLLSNYGATEVGSIATADARDVVAISGAAGYVQPGVSVESVDESGNPLGPDREGNIRIRTPLIAQGYVGQPEASARAFRDGWFYPGDYGYLTAERLLVITGRQETRLNVGGDKINPERIEEVLKAFPAVNDAAVLTIPSALGVEDVYALIQTDSIFDSEALRAHCRSKISRSFVPVRFIAVDRIPRGETGKIQRGQLLELAKKQIALTSVG
jgi:acyl-coenzyme A synthetase/AMP-(fatty) acid ligase